VPVCERTARFCTRATCRRQELDLHAALGQRTVLQRGTTGCTPVHRQPRRGRRARALLCALPRWCNARMRNSGAPWRWASAACRAYWRLAVTSHAAAPAARDRCAQYAGIERAACCYV